MKRSLVGKIWLASLFVVSGIMLFGILPYQLIHGNFNSEYIIPALFWLLIWRYAYKKNIFTTGENTERYSSDEVSTHSNVQLSQNEINILNREKTVKDIIHEE